MKTKILILMLVLLPLRAFALFGVGDIVFDPQNYANSVSSQVQNIAKWVQQSEQMVMQITHLQSLINFQNQLQQIQGDIRGVANSIMGPANQIMSLQQTLLQVPTLSSIKSSLNPTRTLVTGFQFRADRGAPGQYFTVNNNVVWRDPNKYKGFEAERVALANQEQAQTEQEQLEKKELAEIQRNQATLSGSPTQAQATVAQAAIDASKARMETMNLRTMRANESAKHFAEQRAMEDAIINTTAEEERKADAADVQARAQASLVGQQNFRFVYVRR